MTALAFLTKGCFHNADIKVHSSRLTTSRNRGHFLRTTSISFIRASWVAVSRIGTGSLNKVSGTLGEHAVNMINGSIRADKECRHCRPGGWIECQELDVDARTDDGSFPPDSWIRKWCENQELAAQKAGLTLRISGESLRRQMESAGFTNIIVREFKIPIGPWPEDRKMRNIGAYQLVAMLEGLESLTLRLWTKYLDWSTTEIEVALAKVRGEFKRRDVHSYWPL